MYTQGWGRQPAPGGTAWQETLECNLGFRHSIAGTGLAITGPCWAGPLVTGCLYVSVRSGGLEPREPTVGLTGAELGPRPCSSATSKSAVPSAHGKACSNSWPLVWIVW